MSHLSKERLAVLLTYARNVGPCLLSPSELIELVEGYHPESPDFCPWCSPLVAYSPEHHRLVHGKRRLP
jgi:hypothetical protein